MRSIRQAYQLNESRACGLVGITRWINQYQSRRDPQDQLRQRLRELAGNRPRYGYRRLTVMLRREGWKVNTKRVYRIYREENLGVRTAKRKKRSSHLRVALPQPTRPNQRWSMDFVSDRLADGRWFRILTVVDQYTRECLCAYADRSQTGEKVVVQMKRLTVLRGVPESITTDNGGEFAGKGMEAWAYQNDVKLDLIRPGKPVENGYIESFNGRLRDECLNGEIFFNLADTRENSNAGAVTTMSTALIVRSMTEHRRSLRTSHGSGASLSPASIRQAHNPVKGPLPPGKRRPPLTGPRSCLRNLR